MACVVYRAACCAAALDRCPCCSIAVARVTLDTEHALAFGDGYPVAEGHTLVVPRLHVPSIFDLAPEAQASVWKLVAQVRAQLLDDLHPDGFTIGLNDGVAAEQTEMHVHVHVIPRWNGDVADPRCGVRWVIPDKAAYWKTP